jgi:hypothetical protein
MALDLVLRQARRPDAVALADIGIADGRIVDIAQRISADARAEDVDGRLVIAGFVAPPPLCIARRRAPTNAQTLLLAGIAQSVGAARIECAARARAQPAGAAPIGPNA